MANILTINRLSFKYDKEYIFKDCNLNIKKGEFIYIVSPNKSGKSTLIKLLNDYPYSGEIKVNDVSLKKSNMSIINDKLKIIDINYVKECKVKSVIDKLDELMIDNASILKDYKLLNICDKDYSKVSIFDKIKIIIFTNLVANIEIMILEDILEYLNNYDKEIMYKLIKKYNRKNKITVIIFSNKSYGMVYSKRIILLNLGKILFDGNIKEVVKNENLFNELSIDLPFMLDLSIKLKLYDLIDDVYTDEVRMIKEVWKK